MGHPNVHSYIKQTDLTGGWVCWLVGQSEGRNNEKDMDSNEMEISGGLTSLFGWCI